MWVWVMQQAQLQAGGSTSEGMVREQVDLAQAGLYVMQQAQLQALRITSEAAAPHGVGGDAGVAQQATAAGTQEQDSW